MTRVMLTRHDQATGHWHVLREGKLETLKAVAHLDELLRIMAAWPGQEIGAIQRGIHRTGQLAPERSKARPRPGPFTVIRVWSRIGKPPPKRVEPQRNIGILYHPIHELLDPDPNTNVRWLPSPSDEGSRSSPFGFRAPDGRLHVLYAKRGRKAGDHGIARIRPKRDNVLKRSRQMLEGEGFGYPYTFLHDGAVWTVVEERDPGQVRLFRMDGELERIDPVATLLDHVLCSPTLFMHDGSWWLMGTMPPFEDEALHLFMARSITGPYTPHPMAPALFDPGCARPAGTPFVHDGVLYRPALEIRPNGMERIAMKRIIRLDPEDFHEELAKHVEPVQGSTWSHGIRTLCGLGDVTLVDGRRAIPGMPLEKREDRQGQRNKRRE